MKLYKYLKEEKYLQDWESNKFVFTKLTEFLKKDDHRSDRFEGAQTLSYPEEFTLHISGFETALSDNINREMAARLRIPEVFSDRNFISSFSKKKDCARLKSEFGNYVAEIDFNEDLQQEFERYGIGFGDVVYDNKVCFSKFYPGKAWYQVAEELGKDNLRKPLLLKREEYSYQEEFRFFFFLPLPNQPPQGNYVIIDISKSGEWKIFNK